jgi:hypothetical protein
MKFIVALLLTCSVLFSCKKDEKTDVKLSGFAMTANLDVDLITPVDLTVHIVGDTLNLPTEYRTKLSYIKTRDTAWTAWKEIAITSDTMVIKDLEHNSIYEVKLEVTNGTQTMLSDKRIIRTGSFQFNADALIESVGNNGVAERNYLNSGERTTHYVYGRYFTSVPAPLTAKIVDRTDLTKVIDVPLETLNDSTLVFQMPENLLPAASEKELYKAYYLKVGERFFGYVIRDTPIVDTFIYKVYRKN